MYTHVCIYKCSHKCKHMESIGDFEKKNTLPWRNKHHYYFLSVLFPYINLHSWITQGAALVSHVSLHEQRDHVLAF